MTSLHAELLPLIQAINEEGGNMSTFLLDQKVLDAIDGGAETDNSLKTIAAKIREKHAACANKRSHLAFNQIFEAYSEGLVYLAAKARGVDLRAVSDGSKHGKTPDFETLTSPEIGFEVKTLNVVDPERNIDGFMDRAFEAGYAAGQTAKSKAAGSPSGVGMGFGETEHYPHGAGTSALNAISQTISKIDSNLKQGQYSDRPTILVVSLSRLGLLTSSSNLKSLYDNHEDDQVSGHLFAVAAHPVGAPIIGYDDKPFLGSTSLGSLNKNGILHDHPYVAGIAFVASFGAKEKTLHHELKRSVRVHGIWNDEWETKADFTENQKARAKAVFDQFCDFWNDTRDTRGSQIADTRALQANFFYHVNEFTKHNRGSAAHGLAFEQFVVEADRLYHVWRCAEEKVDFAKEYVPVDAADIAVGLTHTKQPTILVTARHIDERIPRLELIKTSIGTWTHDDALGPISNHPIEL